MSSVVCYLERRSGGAILRRARLVGPGLDRTWTAPEESPGDALAEGVALANVKSAAAWVRETLAQEGLRRLADVVVDSDGATCSWLSAPSANDEIVVAALMQSGTGSEVPGALSAAAGGASGTTAVGAAAAAAMVSTEASVQALAQDGESSAGGGGFAALRGGRAGGGPAVRKRFAVLATPDTPVRVFLDQLDAAGIEVERVSGLWHALCRSWDPGAPAVTDAGGGAAERIVAEGSPATAILMIDPAGSGERLAWAWAKGGVLVAGGTMRLRRAPGRVRAAEGTTGAQGAGEIDDAVGRAFADAGVSSAGGAGGAGAETGAARRIATEDRAESVGPLVCGRAEVGRLVLDWLSFSAQLGHAPERVVCLGPATAWIDDDGGKEKPYTLAEGLAAAWPGATVDVAHHADPVGLTLARLRERGLRPDVPSSDPRLSLSALSSRPGRADRRFTVWTAAAILAGAALVGVLGWQVRRAAGSARNAQTEARAARQQLLTELEPKVPGITRERDPVGRLQSRLGEIREAAAGVTVAKPVFDETLRMIKAMEGAQDTKVTRMLISSTGGVVSVDVPDATTGPQIYTALQGLPGSMVWNFSSPPSRGNEENARRTVTFTGVWPEVKPSSNFVPPPTGTTARRGGVR